MTPRAVLIGPPGAGKSTIGRRLAQALDLPLLDTDAEIERTTGRTIPDIFGTDGEPAFRRIEEEVVADALARHDGIVSLGGGAILSERTRALLQGRTVIYLEISVAEGLRRTGTNTTRPLLAGADPAAKYRELMRRRRPLYRQAATIRVRTDGRSPGRVVQQVLAKLEAQSDLAATGAHPSAPSTTSTENRSNQS
ncbi:shikimate kinase [Rhodococcus ruber Chol-4]|uniref:shikimate kinase n=1 Tax=Rhodococcus TaxID=1827 RepID=UPI00034A6FA9|nr:MULTISPECIES: shikimate kinase [Rhodococcus]RIK13743.1 MAG: shikimate kinase [Acidobacteriota bacterium]AUM15275.1 shikimate kinase [Rhodococcus ruber]AWG99130.1 shikimate kinase [Rhodococcus ruber]AXY52190.1 shikimate kinase [Rhodococcus ruber]KXF86600.1 shikimate kinase [Rhodococcus ruber Chol-4]